MPGRLGSPGTDRCHLPSHPWVHCTLSVHRGVSWRSRATFHSDPESLVPRCSRRSWAGASPGAPGGPLDRCHPRCSRRPPGHLGYFLSHEAKESEVTKHLCTHQQVLSLTLSVQKREFTVKVTQESKLLSPSPCGRRTGALKGTAPHAFVRSSPSLPLLLCDLGQVAWFL